MMTEPGDRSPKLIAWPVRWSTGELLVSRDLQPPQDRIAQSLQTVFRSMEEAEHKP